MRGHLPGTTDFTQRLEGRAKALEQHWFIKIVVIFAAITGVVIFGLEMWRLWRPH